VFGLVHEAPKWLPPTEVSAIASDEQPRIWYVACADVHPSHDLRIDQFGIYYTGCCTPIASGFFKRMEQDAFIWQFTRNRKARYVPLWLYNEPGEIREMLLPRLEGHEVGEISDQYGKVYATDQMAVTGGRQMEAWVISEGSPPELAGLRLGMKK
jgi:hypothetical protein